MDDIKVVRMCAAGGCILCIMTPIFSIIPICIFELREGNKIGCAGPGVGIHIIYVLIISINQRCVFAVFRWMKKLVFPRSNENQDDNCVVGQIRTDLRKHFIKALRPYSAPGRREGERRRKLIDLQMDLMRYLAEPEMKRPCTTSEILMR